MSKLLLLGLALFSIAAMAADLSGTWTAAVETDAGSGTPTFVFKQTGDQLTGTYTGALGEGLKVSGTLKGNQVTWSFDASGGGESVKVVYSGTLGDDGKIKGTVELGSLGKGTFTATKK
ncbi:MAG TPA: hypothetical protein VGV35_09905 [Bryobacteraceae bacterium]|nr:hypothetical protein [Bryobacteraceae bacterium]